ncbi:hypothetical protein TWF696_003785 [Orbilia brochopaga]|uniref:Uncharacterized protein n=1 Tax=Orbilia brochopaga TaxID=3140254 RepID=A0AAV9V509_9PEZI
MSKRVAPPAIPPMAPLLSRGEFCALDDEEVVRGLQISAARISKGSECSPSTVSST